MRGMLPKSSSLALLRNKYLGVVPWALVHATTLEGAKTVVKQIRAHSLESHDPLTLVVWRRLQNDIVAVSEGRPSSDSLDADCDLIDCCCNFDESGGEGVHRDRTHEKSRAPQQ